MKFTIEVNYAEIQMLKALLRSAPGTGWTSMQEQAPRAPTATSFSPGWKL